MVVGSSPTRPTIKSRVCAGHIGNLKVPFWRDCDKIVSSIKSPRSIAIEREFLIKIPDRQTRWLFFRSLFLSRPLYERCHTSPGRPPCSSGESASTSPGRGQQAAHASVYGGVRIAIAPIAPFYYCGIGRAGGILTYRCRYSNFKVG